jgi:hypothetical protein
MLTRCLAAISLLTVVTVGCGTSGSHTLAVAKPSTAAPSARPSAMSPAIISQFPGAAEVRTPMVGHYGALTSAELTGDVSGTALLHGYYCVRCADREIYNAVIGKLPKP